MKIKKYKNNLITFNLLIIIISFIISINIIAYFSKQSEKILLPYAKSKIQEIVSSIINHSTENIEYKDKLYNLDKQDNEIKMINYNNKEVVKLLDKITFNIENKLNNKELIYG